MNTEKNVKFINGTQVINSYLKDVRKQDVLTNEEELELFKQYEDGDMSARDKIIIANQRFVYSQAKIYAKNEEDIMDYVSEGNIGMLEAIEKFDYKKGFKFITFAVWYIKRSMNFFMNNDRECITKCNNAKYGKKIDKIKNEFYIKNERYPYPDEIAEILKEKYDIDVCDLSDLYELEIESIDQNIDDDITFEETQDFSSKTAYYNEYEEQENNTNEEGVEILAKNLLNILPNRNKDVIMKYFGIGGEKYSMEDLCMEYHMYEKDLKKIIAQTIKYLKQEYYKKPEKYTNNMVG